jgi:uncharacterized protein (TIGR03000 family)
MMRKTLLILSLAGLTVLAGASDAFAQRRGYGGGRGYYGGRGYGPSISIGLGGGYYSGYGYGGLGYSPFYPGYGNAYQYAPSYYVEPQVRQSYYPAPAAVQQHANLTVLVPTADAKVWFDGNATSQQGTERLFHSPDLEPSHNFTYTIKARWMENGKAVTRERQINVQAGQSTTINFRANTGENVPPPLPNAIPRD